MEFNKSSFDNFRNDLEIALQGVAEKYQVEIKTGKIKYSTYDFDINLKVTKNNNDVDVTQKKFESECHYYDFVPSDYNRQFKIQGRLFKLVGFNLRSPKNCCQIQAIDDGKIYKCSDDAVKKSWI